MAEEHHNQKEQVYNYRRIFKKPIVIYSIGNWRLPFGIQLKRTMIAVVLLAFLWLVKLVLLQFVTFGLLEIQFVKLMYYIVPAWFGSGFLSEERPIFNGKNVFDFTKDYLNYWWNVKRTNKLFNDEEEVSYSAKEIQFDENELILLSDDVKDKGDKKKHAKIKETLQSDIQEYASYKHRPSVGVLSSTEPDDQRQ